MSEDRIPTHIWTGGVMRQLAMEGRPAYVMQKGDASGGIVLVKIALLDGNCHLKIQQRDIDGKLGWVSALKDDLLTESRADEYIRRAIERDPDLWVIEVEDRAGNNPFSDAL